MKQTLLGVLAWLIYRPLSWTWRITLHEPECMRQALGERRPFIMAHWHGDDFALMHTARRYRLVTMASPSKDGRIITTVLKLMGARVSAGSSSRGGASGLKRLIRWTREGHNCSFAVDGPRGPIYKMKPGVLEASRLLECPIYYASVSCDRAFHMSRSWDRSYVPKPFARLAIEWRGPFNTVARSDDPRDPALVDRLEQLMLRAKREGLVNGQEIAGLPEAAPESPVT